MREEKRDGVVRDEKSQIGRHKSFIDPFLNRKRNNKIAPDGVKKGKDFDVQEFMREVERRGSIIS